MRKRPDKKILIKKNLKKKPGSKFEGVIVNPGREVAVIGAGVIGLTTAVELQNQGYSVTIYTAKKTEHTTSMKAGASFKPHAVAYTDATHQMLLDSFGPYVDLSKDPKSGVRMHTHWEATDHPETKNPKDERYLEVFKDFQEVEEDIPGGYKYAWKYTTPFIDPNIYLPYLESRFLANSGVIFERKFEQLEELEKLPHGVIFNCTGLGARELFGDKKMLPIRGQIAVIDPIPDKGFSMSADGCYFYQREANTVLGGTAEWGEEKEIVKAQEIARIVKGNQRVIAELTHEMVKRTYAGLRPYREGAIRLMLEMIGKKPVVHIYGHGGSGFTLAPGSAKMAVAQIA